MLESELFGHERGVYRGRQTPEGRFVEADGGTLLR
ncbi:MAG: sigma 54-interacting transcriptional regulator [Escherichia coli]